MEQAMAENKNLACNFEPAMVFKTRMRYIPVMRSWILIGLCALAALPGGREASAITPGDLKQTYLPIIDRNPFGLKPPAPPPTNNAAAKTPEVPKTDIWLTGIVSVGYPKIAKRAYMKTQEGGKKDPVFYSLSEGQARDGIEVLAIDEVARTVKIKWEKGETLLSFQTHGITNVPPPVAAPQPGRPGAPGVPPPLTPGMPDPNAHHVTAPGGFQPPANNAAYNGSQPGAMDAGMNRQIPTRPVRVRGGDLSAPQVVGGAPGGAMGNPALPGGAPEAAVPDPAEAYLRLRVQEEVAKRENRFAPPTPPLLPQ
jgi:hypothetical protein